VTEPVLTRRAVNRATLARQLLLERSDRRLPAALTHLIGLQAQTPHSWYVGLWSRLAGFQPDAVGAALLDRGVVRVALMRGTIHVVTAADGVALRPLLQPVFDRAFATNHGKRIGAVDPAELLAAGRSLLDAAPLTFSELGRQLGQRFPGADPDALAQAMRAWLTLIQVPPRGVWGRSGLARHTTAEAWLGRAARPARPLETLGSLVLRYLDAFGPATVRDVQAWSGLTRLAEVVAHLGDRVIRFRGEDGAELYDRPDAPRPDPETPAPPRFLYDFDNLLLSHADRSRVVTAAYAAVAVSPNGVLPSAFLVDGVTAGVWRVIAAGDRSTLTIRPFAKLSTKDTKALAREGTGLLELVAAGRVHAVEFEPPVRP
jgi:Winged helix DNA-binding domain